MFLDFRLKRNGHQRLQSHQKAIHVFCCIKRRQGTSVIRQNRRLVLPIYSLQYSRGVYFRRVLIRATHTKYLFIYLYLLFVQNKITVIYHVYRGFG